MEEKVKAFLELATQKKASDIFIIAGRPLSVKIDGKLCTLDGFEERLMPPETDEFIRIIYKLAHDRNIEPMLETGDDDCIQLLHVFYHDNLQCLFTAINYVGTLHSY